MSTDEAASDKAYNEAYAIMTELAETIMTVSRGQIDKPTAWTMVRSHSDKLITLCEKFS